jgi:hypothetical protein
MFGAPGVFDPLGAFMVSPLHYGVPSRVTPYEHIFLEERRHV